MKVRLEIAPCEELSEACETAQRLADACGDAVHFDFNSVRCVAVPKGDAGLLADRQNLAQRTTLCVRSSKEATLPELIETECA